MVVEFLELSIQYQDMGVLLVSSVVGASLSEPTLVSHCHNRLVPLTIHKKLQQKLGNLCMH